MMVEHNRIEWLDISKGLVIFLMVIGHTSIPEPISKWIWSFHMPFFFFISGVFFNEKKYGRWKTFGVSRMRQLFIPYVLMSFVVFITLYPLGDVKSDELFSGWKGYPLWFVPVLLMAEILGAWVIKTPIKKTIIAMTAILLVIAYVLWYIHWHFAFKVEAVPLACFYFLLGWLVQDKIFKLRIRVALIVVISFFHLGLSQVLPKLDMCFYNFGCWANPIASILGIMSVLAVSHYYDGLEKFQIIRKCLIWAGKNTLIIMGFASMIIMLMNDFLEQTTIPKGISSPLKHVILWIILYILIVLINKYIPEMAGKKRK